VVDKTLLATKIAAVRDAVARIRSVLPDDVAVFVADRTTREVVVLNLFVALQECVSLAAHWLADEWLDVPQGYRADHPAAQYLKHRQFYGGAEFPASLAYSKAFYPTLVATFKALMPLVRFLNEPLLVERERPGLKAGPHGWVGIG